MSKKIFSTKLKLFEIMSVDSLITRYNMSKINSEYSERGLNNYGLKTKLVTHFVKYMCTYHCTNKKKKIKFFTLLYIMIIYYKTTVYELSD